MDFWTRKIKAHKLNKVPNWKIAKVCICPIPPLWVQCRRTQLIPRSRTQKLCLNGRWVAQCQKVLLWKLVTLIEEIFGFRPNNHYVTWKNRWIKQVRRPFVAVLGTGKVNLSLCHLCHLPDQCKTNFNIFWVYYF